MEESTVVKLPLKLHDLAQEAKKPVKIVWTREEEFVWAYFRPGGVIEVSAGVKKDGTITAWKFNNYNSGGAGLDTQYKVSNQQIAHLPSDYAIKTRLLPWVGCNSECVCPRMSYDRPGKID